MRRSLSACMMLIACALPAHAFELDDSWPVRLRGRLETAVTVDRGSSPFAFDFTSASPQDRTRVMLDLTGGGSRYGTLYLKGAGAYRFSTSVTDKASFSFAQGDYSFARGYEEWSFLGRIFSNERRYFTGEQGGVLLDDDRIDDTSRSYGGRLDTRMEAFGITLLGAGLEDETRRARGIGYARAGWFGEHVQLSASYLYDAPPDSLSDHRIAKGEVTGFYRRLTATVSYEQSDIDGVPNDGFDWGEFDGSNYSTIAPENGATFAELRMRDLSLGEKVAGSIIARYRAVGSSYYNSLSTDSPGRVTTSVGVYGGHRERAVDGRLVYRRDDDRLAGVDREQLSATLRTMYTNNVDAYLRGALGRRKDVIDGDVDENFLHAGFTRILKKYSAGLHAMALSGREGGAAWRWGTDLRINMSASVSIYGRLIQNIDAMASDALFARIEFRPLPYIFATFGYGRTALGDAPFVLEDPRIGDTGPTDNVYTFTIRGDLQ